MTGGQGAMGSAGRYGGSLLAGGGGYQGGGLGAGGSATLAGSGHDHGSYGDLRAAPGSGIARHQQPFAPMLFSSPGASAGLGRGAGLGFDASASPATQGGQGPAAQGRAGTAGYFTTGGTAHGPAARGTPGSHGPAARGSFFGGGAAAGDVTPVSGRRVFGANRSSIEARTSDGAGGKSAALDSGHVGTPWGDKGKPSPVRGLNATGGGLFGNDPGASGDGSGMNDADGSPNEAWVTVFGFPPGSLAAVLEAFQRDGDVVTHDSFASSADTSRASENESGPNWVHVRFATGAGAARALRRNGTKVSGVMVGVRRLDDDARAVVEREHGGAGLLANASGERAGGGGLAHGGRRIVRPVAGMSAPGARPSRFQPSKEGVALQPRRSVWNNIVEIVFGL